MRSCSPYRLKRDDEACSCIGATVIDAGMVCLQQGTYNRKTKARAASIAFGGEERREYSINS